MPDTAKPGVGNKAIALKNCHNVILSDFSILYGGWFGILATGVDNLTIDNLKIDTNRDGMDIDCCRNVRVSNCTVNSPCDDGICPKSSFALGYARPTENVTITNCYVTGGYEIGTVLDGTWKRMPDSSKPSWPPAASSAAPNPTAASATSPSPTASSNTAAACARNRRRRARAKTSPSPASPCATRQSPLFLRLGERMRGPQGADSRARSSASSSATSPATMPRNLPSILSGVPGHFIEDVKISDVYLHQVGGGGADDGRLQPPEREKEYPEPTMFGELPAIGLVRPPRQEISNSATSRSPRASPICARPFRLSTWTARTFSACVFRGPLRPQCFPSSKYPTSAVFGSQFLPDIGFPKVDEKLL